MTSSIPLSLSPKKVIYRFYTLLFLNIFFLNLKYRNGLPNNYFLFLVFWKLILKMGAKHIKYKNYYLKTSFKFNFLKIVLYYFENKNKNPSTNQALIILKHMTIYGSHHTLNNAACFHCLPLYSVIRICFYMLFNQNKRIRHGVY